MTSVVKKGLIRKNRHYDTGGPYLQAPGPPQAVDSRSSVGGFHCLDIEQEELRGRNQQI